MTKPQERTKVVVRNLPPALTEEALRGVVDKLAAGRYGWSAFYAGKARRAADAVVRARRAARRGAAGHFPACSIGWGKPPARAGRLRRRPGERRAPFAPC
jgi:hypothetical protein